MFSHIVGNILQHSKQTYDSLAAMLASLLHPTSPHMQSHSYPPLKGGIDVQITPMAEPIPRNPDDKMESFLRGVTSLFESPLHPDNLHAMSNSLQQEFREKLKASKMCMLPSFHHTLPTGQEQGTVLALDVGGSTFRIAVIELTGREGNNQSDGMEIKRLRSFGIDDSVRSLRGPLFFDWMACRIEEVLDADHDEADNKANGPLPMALAWSFPIEQTSTRSGSLLAMGKGFLATSGVEGRDIGELVTSACLARKLNVELQGIVNDASATLLSQAYREPSTRISLILGTGINSAVYLPVASLEREKFGQREDSWFAEARHVLVNTELSMFGNHVWESTRWDEELNATHPIPDFQPLEYKASGRYLGELVRLVMVEAVGKGVLFEGYMPKGLETAYSFDTGLLGLFECDSTPNLARASAALTAAHPVPCAITPKDLLFIRQVSTLVTSRAAAYVATAVHALWSLQQDAASECACCRAPILNGTETGDKEPGHKTTIACNGSIMEKYPDFKTRCQQYLDGLVQLSCAEAAASGKRAVVGTVDIEMAVESSVFGAAVSAAAEG